MAEDRGEQIDGLPDYLRDDAPYQHCARCGRKTCATEDFNTECRMTQPDGFPCGGSFGPTIHHGD